MCIRDRSSIGRHARYTLRNVWRAVRPLNRHKCYGLQLNRTAAIFTVLADVLLVVYGPKIKLKEYQSGRMADLMIKIYQGFAVWSRYRDTKYSRAAGYVCYELLHEIYATIRHILRNVPMGGLIGKVLRVNKYLVPPSDKHKKEIVCILEDFLLDWVVHEELTTDVDVFDKK